MQAHSAALTEHLRPEKGAPRVCRPGGGGKSAGAAQELSESLDKPLCISVFGPRPSSGAASASSKSTQTSGAGNGGAVSGFPDIDKYVRRLYACNNQCDFTQPPPPYLSYSYPPINGEILARIGQSLQTNSHFYNQVLHLMNRMNLEPPFEKRPDGLMAQMHRQHVGTQTELIPSESESELESDDGEQKVGQKAATPSSSCERRSPCQDSQTSTPNATASCPTS